MATRILNQLLDLHPVFRWLAVFLLVFVMTFIAYIALLTPLVLLGMVTYGNHVPGAVGCGIGTGLVHATALTFLE